jgi:hypothetical protein
VELSREDRFLLECLTAKDSNGIAFGLKRLKASDWGFVIQQSVKHAVAPLLYQRLKGLSPGVSVPAGVFERLREIYLNTVATNMRFQHELSKRLKILKDNDIPVIVLKGTHLGEVAYGNIGLRAMCDVDLLVRKNDLSKVQRRLMETGYYPYNNSLPLDVHWSIEHNIVPPLPIDEEKLWARAEASSIAGVEVLVLSPEDLLLHLCIHLSFHHLFGFAGVRTLCDIRQTIQHYKIRIDWNVVHDRAREWRVGKAIYLALLLAKELVSAEVPDSILAALKSDDTDPHKQWAIQQMFNGAADGGLLSPFFCFLWRPVSIRQKAAHLLKFMFPPSEYVSERCETPHRSSGNYLSYLTRVKEHFGRYVRATWKLLTRDEEFVGLVHQQNQNTAMREWLSSNPVDPVNPV